jgi:hypothetical protein
MSSFVPTASTWAAHGTVVALFRAQVKPQGKPWAMRSRSERRGAT